MTKNELKVSIKGFLMDLNGIRKAEQEEMVLSVGYEVSKAAFEILTNEVKKHPFKNDYEITIFDDVIDKDKLEKISDLVLYNNNTVNEHLNKNLTVEGIRRIWIGATYCGSKYGLKIRVYFDN